MPSEAIKARARANINGLLDSLAVYDEAFDWDTACSSESAIRLSGIAGSPTPEQALDSGSADGIAAISADGWRKRHAPSVTDRRNGIPTLMKNPRTSGKATTRIERRQPSQSHTIIRSDGHIYHSIREVTAKMRCDNRTLKLHARLGSKFKGYYWTILPSAKYQEAA